VANEAWQNGFDTPAEVRALGARLARGPVLVTLTAPGSPGQACALYADGAADLATLHYDRDIGGMAGPWGPHLQPWTYPARFDEECRSRLPQAVANNEPIGPQSSVEADADPLRLAVGMAISFLAGHGVHTLHAGPGVQGGNAYAASRGRVADYGALAPDVLAALAATRARLPAGLANWTRLDLETPALPWEGVQQALDDGLLAGAYAATHGDRVVLALAGIGGPVAVSSRVPVSVDVYDPRTGRPLVSLALATGERWQVDPSVPGLLVVATRGVTATGANDGPRRSVPFRVTSR
jgi:hypothetical protein